MRLRVWEGVNKLDSPLLMCLSCLSASSLSSVSLLHCWSRQQGQPIRSCSTTGWTYRSLISAEWSYTHTRTTVYTLSCDKVAILSWNTFSRPTTSSTWKLVHQTNNHSEPTSNRESPVNLTRTPFGEAGETGENQHRHRENTKTPHRNTHPHVRRVRTACIWWFSSCDC